MSSFKCRAIQVKLFHKGRTFAMIPAVGQQNPAYIPTFLPVNVGTAGATPSTSLWNVPTFTMPTQGFIADNVSVTILMIDDGETIPAGTWLCPIIRTDADYQAQIPVWMDSDDDSGE